MQLTPSSSPFPIFTTCVIIPDTRWQCLTLSTTWRCANSLVVSGAGYFRLWFDSFLSVSYLRSSRTEAPLAKKKEKKRKDHLSRCCLCLFYKFLPAFIIIQERFLLHTFSSVIVNKCLSLRSPCFQSPHFHWLTFLKSFVWNVKAETLPSPPTPTESGLLFNICSSVRPYTDTPTQCSVCVCVCVCVFCFRWNDSPCNMQAPFRFCLL